jgi:hypothetical protein
MMNRIPRTRFVTLMAAAAGVSAGLASLAPTQALASTSASASFATDTLPTKAALAAKKAADKAVAAPAKTADATKKAEAAKTADAKKVDAKGFAKAVATAGPNNPSPNDACGDDADCRNLNGDGAGW